MTNFSFRPYPAVSSVQRDLKLARQIYPSQVNELSVFSDYIYYSIVFEALMPEVAAIFEELALAELNHFNLLGELIYTLGGNPAVNTRIKNSPAQIVKSPAEDAMNEAERILASLIASEDRAAEEYARLVEESNDNPAATAILSRFAAEEAEHARILRRIVIV